MVCGDQKDLFFYIGICFCFWFHHSYKHQRLATAKDGRDGHRGKEWYSMYCVWCTAYSFMIFTIFAVLICFFSWLTEKNLPPKFESYMGKGLNNRISNSRFCPFELIQSSINLKLQHFSRCVQFHYGWNREKVIPRTSSATGLLLV